MVSQVNLRCRLSMNQHDVLSRFRSLAIALAALIASENAALAKRGGLQDAVTGNRVLSVTFSPDGKLLAGGSVDKSVKIWDAKTGDLKFTLKGHRKTVRIIAFSPTEPLMASGSDDRTVMLWNANTGECVRTIDGFQHRLNALKFSSNGKTLWAASNDITSWDVETGEQRFAIALNVRSVLALDVSPGKKHLAAITQDQDNVVQACILDLKSRVVTQTFGGKGNYILALGFSPNGNQLAGTYYSPAEGPSIRIWNPTTGDRSRVLTPEYSEIWALAYSANGRMLASGGEGPWVETLGFRGKHRRSELTVWNPETMEIILLHHGARGRLTSLCFSPDGKHLAYCDERSVCVVEVQSGDVVWAGDYGAK